MMDFEAPPQSVGYVLRQMAMGGICYTATVLAFVAAALAVGAVSIADIAAVGTDLADLLFS